ncbi:M23 family metallopeptidase [Brevibacillus reuszeri]|uniref:M23 family metallopeptidase n=1 Tax=Brevibacillus reuszeri TaxID=54915 RepID=UPI001F3DEEC7|nr:M23 family metallopeptidase [Brevibacillus reuszeri]
MARIAGSDPEKAIKIGLGIVFGVLMLIMLLFAAPIAFIKHMPLGSSQDEYDYYTKGAEQIETVTGVKVSWQYIMAVDAVILDQNFKKSSVERAYGYKDYFVREEQVKVEKTCTDAKGKSYDCSYYETHYYLRDFDETLQMLVADGKLKQDQIQEVMDKVEYVFNVSDGKISFEGDSGDVEEDDTGIFQPVDGAMGWPTEQNLTRISSPFGWRTHPITGRKKLHKGTDIPAPIGTNVYAARAGRVVSTSWAGSGGNMVAIDHGDGMTTKYMHLNSFVARPGQSVEAGQLIAKSGNTGGSTGPHLHFQVEINGESVNAMQYYR